MKLTKSDIQFEAYKAFKKIIFESIEQPENSGKEKIKKLASLGEKIESQIQNSLTHLNSFMSLGIKTEDNFEFERAVAEIGRIQKLTADYAQVITAAHETAENSTELQRSTEQQPTREFKRQMDENPIDPAKPVKTPIAPPEDSEDDAELIDKAPGQDAKHWYETKKIKGLTHVRKVPSQKTLKSLGATKIKESEDTEKPEEITLVKHNEEEAERGDEYTVVKTADELNKKRAEGWQIFQGNKGKLDVKEEKVEFATGADGQPIYPRDRVQQQTFDPKKGTYVWSKSETYRVERILDPKHIQVKDFKSEKEYPMNAKEVRRVGKAHMGIYEYGAILQNRYDVEDVITKDVKARSLNEAIRLLGGLFPAYEVFKIFEEGRCTNCNHLEDYHENGHCEYPGCHCTKFED